MPRGFELATEVFVLPISLARFKSEFLEFTQEEYQKYLDTLSFDIITMSDWDQPLEPGSTRNYKMKVPIKFFSGADIIDHVTLNLLEDTPTSLNWAGEGYAPESPHTKNFKVLQN